MARQEQHQEKYKPTFKGSKSGLDDEAILLNAMWAAFTPEEQAAWRAKMSLEEQFNFACVIGRARHLIEEAEVREQNRIHIQGKLRFVTNLLSRIRRFV
ncbi:hypothetical protein KKE03_03405 [Patescibacteria group bacterium]|nr:hypothetical protein [Patescibacteria group bacterium]